MNVCVDAPPAMRFALEPYSEKLVQEMRPLWDAHHEEVPQLGLAVDPDLTMYSVANKTGTLRIFTARIGRGGASILVGYQTFFVMRHPHRKYSLEASQDLLYVDPEVRKGLAAVKFMKWCWEELKREGVQAIFQQISAKNDFGRILERYGFEKMDVTYARRI